MRSSRNPHKSGGDGISDVERDNIFLCIHVQTIK